MYRFRNFDFFFTLGLKNKEECHILTCYSCAVAGTLLVGYFAINQRRWSLTQNPSATCIDRYLRTFWYMNHHIKRVKIVINSNVWTICVCVVSYQVPNHLLKESPRQAVRKAQIKYTNIHTDIHTSTQLILRASFSRVGYCWLCASLKGF